MSDSLQTSDEPETRLEQLLRSASGDVLPEESEEELEPFILIRTAGMQLGVLAHSVVEISTSLEATPLPGAPKYIRGLFLLKGRLVPIISLPALLGSERAGAIADNTHLVVLGHEDIEVAILAHSVEGIVHLSMDQGLSNHSNIDWISLSIEHLDGMVDRVDVAKLLKAIVDGQR